MQKAFKMTIHTDSQITARSTMPDAMYDTYYNSDPVPDLNSLNEFRSDGKVSLKFYTDPTYFFELWKEKMTKEVETRKKKKVRCYSLCNIYSSIETENNSFMERFS